MTTHWTIIIALACCTFAIRLGGVLLGQRLPTSGAWARGIQALPGCLLIALVANLILSGGPNEWAASTLALLAACLTRNLPLTMVVGMGTVLVLRHYGPLLS